MHIHVHTHTHTHWGYFHGAARSWRKDTEQRAGKRDGGKFNGTKSRAGEVH